MTFFSKLWLVMSRVRTLTLGDLHLGCSLGGADTSGRAQPGERTRTKPSTGKAVLFCTP